MDSDMPMEIPEYIVNDWLWQTGATVGLLWATAILALLAVARIIHALRGKS
jgi:hypothetical protein